MKVQYNKPMATKDIVVMAGNARFENLDGVYNVDTQPMALPLAAQCIRELRERILCVGIAVDHKGSFVPQFVKPEFRDPDSPTRLSSKQRKKLTLAHVREDISDRYQDFLESAVLQPSDVRIFTEEMDRSSAISHAKKFPDVRAFFCPQEKWDDNEESCESPDATNAGCNNTPGDGLKPNCAGLTAELLRRLSTQGEDVKEVHTFWQAADHVSPSTVHRGTLLAYEIFKTPVRTAIHQTMVMLRTMDEKERFVVSACEYSFCPETNSGAFDPEGLRYLDEMQ